MAHALMRFCWMLDIAAGLPSALSSAALPASGLHPLTYTACPTANGGPQRPLCSSLQASPGANYTAIDGLIFPLLEGANSSLFEQSAGACWTQHVLVEAVL